jgi:hypothetical protein
MNNYTSKLSTTGNSVIGVTVGIPRLRLELLAIDTIEQLSYAAVYQERYSMPPVLTYFDCLSYIFLV